MSALRATSSTLGPGVLRYALELQGENLAFGDVVDRWRSDASFRAFFSTVLADVPHDAYFWETPPVTRATLERPFEFVAIDGPALDGAAPEPEAFEEHFRGADVATFPNLGGDAVLVAPRRLESGADYPHLAAFARHAPPEQSDALWRAIGEAVHDELGDEPLWLSTAGLGVFWLHVRLDSRPKYYQHAPYRSP